jgi:hypothetical protein
VIGQLLDPVRFPWALAETKPSHDEIERAVTASSALIANQRVETSRRNVAKAQQEGMMKEMLRALHFVEVRARPNEPHNGCAKHDGILRSSKAWIEAR